jgi:DNA-directed RNA polymerase subunit M/transcription elongation factor TFIIS
MENEIIRENDNGERETVERESCPKCGSERFYVNHYLREYHHDRIFLECADCGAFTARVIVHAYVDANPDSDYVLFLQKAHHKAYRSARKASDDYDKHLEKSSVQFHHVKEILESHKKPTPQKVTTKKSRNEKTTRELYEDYRIKEDG